MCIRDRYIWDDNISASELKNVVILANFDVVDQSVTPYFPYTGTWFDLMDEDGDTTLNVASTTDQITLQPGEFKIFGNQASTTLSTIDSEISELKMYPNPSDGYINFNKSIDSVEIFDITGKKVLSFKNIITQQQLDINKLETGYYIIKISNDNNVENKKLIVK